MSDVPSILSYHQLTEPPVRTRQAALGAAIVALEAFLLLAFRAGSQSLALRAAFSADIFPTAILIGVYGMLSICVPLAAHLLIGAKPPRRPSSRAAGDTARRVALFFAWLYCTFRLASGACRVWFYVAQMRGDFNMQRLHLAIVIEALSPPALFATLAAAWLYMADVAARLRRAGYLALATLALGSSLLIVAAMFFQRLALLGSFNFHPAFRSLVASLGDDSLLCTVQLAYWTITAIMLGTQPRT